MAESSGDEVPPLWDLEEDGWCFSYGAVRVLRNGDEGMLRRITDKHTVDVDARDGTTLLMKAADVRSVASVRFLIEHGAAVNIQCGYYKFTALHYACTNNADDEVFEELLLLLLRAGADPTLKDKYGRTPRGSISMPFGRGILG